MTTFLLTISLLLNGISIYFIMILYTRQNRILESEKTQEKFKKDMEDEISAFLLEMKEENEKFIKRFQQLRKRLPLEDNEAVDQPAKLELTREGTHKEQPGQKAEINTKDWAGRADQVFKKQAVKVYQKTMENQEENPGSANNESEKSLLEKNEYQVMEEGENYRNLVVSQVKILQNQGLSIEEIAKKMNKGKTEIELLLKFS